MAIALYRAPQSRQIADNTGQLSDDYAGFFDAIGFTQGAAIPGLAAGATLAQTVATVNLILATLRSQQRIAAS